MSIVLNNPFGFIYITTNMINGKKYIGQRKFTKDWKYYLGSGLNLNRAIKKYGRENFTRNIVAIAYSEEELNKLEIEWIDFLNASKSRDYYNIAGGGYCNTSTGKTEDEIKEWRKKIGNSNIGRIVSEETRNKIRKSLHEYNINHKRILSEETKRKISNAKKGKIQSDEHKNNLSKVRKGKNIGSSNGNSRKVICLTTGEIFDCLSDGHKKYNILLTDISACCRGRKKSAGKHPETGEKLIWMYYEDYVCQNDNGELIFDKTKLVKLN